MWKPQPLLAPRADPRRCLFTMLAISRQYLNWARASRGQAGAGERLRHQWHACQAVTGCGFA